MQCVPGMRTSTDRCPRCFTEDEGRPFEAGLQEQASNRHELRGESALMVSVVGKVGGMKIVIDVKTALSRQCLARDEIPCAARVSRALEILRRFAAQQGVNRPMSSGLSPLSG